MTAILIVDDDPDIVRALKIYLSGEPYEVYEASTGEEAIERIHDKKIDLILMDIMMPKMDGIEATSRIRAESNVPIILLSAKSEDGDKVLGLNIGADDYVTKPFSPAEVIARIRSQLRRYQNLGGEVKKENVLKTGGILMDDSAREVTVDGEPVSLTPMEYGILKLLMQNPGRVFSSSEIYEQVWNESAIGNESTVAVHIRHLREKIEIDPSQPRYIRVIWGHGYRMEVQR
ncbi:MAG: response regulator transcription factor [Solobacterium sp.]|nr:response regulator transcription factor [Solobacterium sp.]MBQ9823798.1 response regulator transcription factor [Solobacterium sp.]